MKKVTYSFIILLAGIILLTAFTCHKATAPNTNNEPVFAKGADIGWLTEMESSGKKFYNAAGQEQDCIQLLKDLGMNSIRLRVWVNPANNWNNTADVVAKAVRAKAKGMRVMIDFHYSDSWADPGQQTKPAAWANLNLTDLQNAVYTHTYQVLTTLKQNGVIPAWVQIGNETNNGMLWPTGMASQSMSNFASLLKQGYNATKEVDSTIQVIVHLSNGYDNSMYKWMFDGLQANGVKWDIIGMSLYPPYNDWKIKNEQCLVNMNDMLSRYGRPIMICEVGMSWDQPDSSYAFLKDIISKTKSLGATRGLGVFYWEPECMPGWNGYTLGSFDNSNKPTKALNAFNN